jgi:nicotinamide-nucleotide adenylyltransferase
MKKKFKLGLFIGRFQPFHKGHMYALEFSAAMCKELVIGIGSAGESGTGRNPLSSKARIRIIRAALDGASLDARCIRFIEIPDFKDDEKWFRYITRKEPGIEAVFSHHWLVKRIFRGHGLAVIMPPWHKRSSLVATKIRRMIKEKRNWRGRVPAGAIKEISLYEKIIRGA